jgi:site-specific DNA recombinase
MKPAAIYARFSTELQNEKSTEDQIALCRTYAARHQLNIIATFEDKARSGASVFGRDGLMQLMDAARQNLFSVVIVEALDRLSRDMEDLAGIHKRVVFPGDRNSGSPRRHRRLNLDWNSGPRRTDAA